jgi:hypothetical protein
MTTVSTQLAPYVYNIIHVDVFYINEIWITQLLMNVRPLA